MKIEKKLNWHIVIRSSSRPSRQDISAKQWHPTLNVQRRRLQFIFQGERNHNQCNQTTIYTFISSSHRRQRWSAKSWREALEVAPIALVRGLWEVRWDDENSAIQVVRVRPWFCLKINVSVFCVDSTKNSCSECPEPISQNWAKRKSLTTVTTQLMLECMY